MILSESVAKRLFGEQDPLGEVLLWDGAHPFTVRGIMAHPPQNSELGFHVLGSMVTTDGPPFGGRRYDSTWIVVPTDYQYDEEDFGRRALAAYRRHVGETAGEKLLTLQALAGHHLRQTNGSRLYLFAVLGAFVLLVACLNYTSLSTARALTRARETGVRKALGASRRELIWQYTVEAIVVVLLAWLRPGDVGPLVETTRVARVVTWRPPHDGPLGAAGNPHQSRHRDRGHRSGASCVHSILSETARRG